MLGAVRRNVASLDAVAAAADPIHRGRAWSDAKVTAHHAITPTSVTHPTVQLDPAAAKVYELIARRYIAQFYPDHEFAQTRLELEVRGQRFTASGRASIRAGWRGALQAAPAEVPVEKDGDDEAQSVPVLREGERVDVGPITLVDKKTTPPTRFTEGTLVQAMTGIARFVSDPAIKALLRETDGIGTPATQASIIQTLFDRRFIEKRGRLIHSTAIARALVEVLPAVTTTPDMTALWEAALKKIGAGQMSLDRFLEGLVRQLDELVQRGRARGPLAVPGARHCLAPGCTGKLRHPSGSVKSFLSCSHYPECSYAALDGAGPPTTGAARRRDTRRARAPRLR